MVQMRSIKASGESQERLEQAGRCAVEVDGEVGVCGVIADDVHRVPVGIEVDIVRALGRRGVGHRDARR